MRFKLLLAIALCACLLGCNDATWVKLFTPPEDEIAAKKYVELLRQRQFDQIERDFEPAFVDSNFRNSLAEMAAIFPDQTAESIKVVGAQISGKRGNGTVEISLEYEFPTKWVFADIKILRKDGVQTVLGFRVAPMTDSVESLNRFTLLRKSAVQYLTLILALCFLVFSFHAFLLCVRSKDIKRKWLWALIVWVGVARFGVNWTTGQYAFTPFAIQIPCILASRPFYGPWTVFACFPLGAVIFLNKRWKMKVTGESIPPLEPGVEEKTAGG
jgi:hypothetical protein